ncbi:MAG: hypothetical protein WBQ93_12165, partial [Candidatus Competibacter sp.]
MLKIYPSSEVPYTPGMAQAAADTPSAADPAIVATAPDPSSAETRPGPTPRPSQSALLTWLKRLALYFGAVFVATAAGIFFFWQIPLLQDLPQLLKNIAINEPVVAKAPAPANPAAPALAGGGQPDA